MRVSWSIRKASSLIKNTKETKSKKRTINKKDIPSVVSIIDEVGLQKMQPRPHYFRPSALFGCDRENVFHYTHAPEDPRQIGPRLGRILEEGNAVHDIIQDKYLPLHPEFWFIKESKISVVVDGFLVRGSCDGVLIRRSDKFMFGIEIKSMAMAEFNTLSKAKDEHKFQARLYMELQKLPMIVIVYWNKNNQNIKEYAVFRDKKCWEEAKERVRYLGSFVKKKKLPMYDKAMCNKKFCRYVSECRRKGAPV